MHKIDRPAAAPPPCLSLMDRKRQNWNDVPPACKAEIRTALVAIQGGHRCAYCEGAIKGVGHVEHFRRKNPAHFPELTFEWSNLFLSCDSNDHCGHYKDQRGTPYHPPDLIKPDVDDPDCYLVFYSNGEVRPRPDLSAVDLHRAHETIRVFNLNERVLSSIRRNSVRAYLKDVEALAGLSDEDRTALFEEELLATRSKPYCTVFRHVLTKR